LNIEIKINGGILYYYDSLSFGTMKIVNSKIELEKKLNTIAPDIMDKNTTYDVFKKQILKKNNLNKVIGIVLMNQKVISGIGNYLRSDILWLSRISPYRKISDITEKELKLIYKNAKLLTWGDYNRKYAIKKNIIKNNNKLPKNYKRNFFVYMQEKDIYGNKVLKEELYEGSQKRFIYWVVEIQK
jgi:formamidopyrimidine-DNA glycosylase